MTEACSGERELAVDLKSTLRRRGSRVTSITEHPEDTQTGKTREAITELVALVAEEIDSLAGDDEFGGC